MKFKIGDKVVVTKGSDKRVWLHYLVGKQATIKQVFKCADPDKGCYDIGEDYIIPEDNLELIKSGFQVGDKVRIVTANHGQSNAHDCIGGIYTVISIHGENYRLGIPHDNYLYWHISDIERVKPIFDINNYQRNYPHDYAMHCKTEEEANIFFRYLRWIGKLWWKSDVIKFKPRNYCFNANCYALVSDNNPNYTILNFEDFDWSDFMKKEFTKKDLKNGDVVKYRNGTVGIVILETGTVILKDNEFIGVNSIQDDLTNAKTFLWNSRDWDIVAVRRPYTPGECKLNAFDEEYGELVYERKEVEEMTLEEVCKALGKEIKIVKNK